MPSVHLRRKPCNIDRNVIKFKEFLTVEGRMRQEQVEARDLKNCAVQKKSV